MNKLTKILLIDDEVALREEISDWLQLEGYHVVQADDGQAGINCAIQERPDLILCDIAMPDVDGYGVLLEVQSDSALVNVPFIFITAYSSTENIRYGMNLGADDYLTKPFDRQALLDAIQTRLQKKEKKDQLYQQQIQQIEQTLEDEKEKAALKSRLVAMFSHDFRNPLAAIQANVSLLGKSTDGMTPEKRQTLAGRAKRNVSQLIQMLDEMLLVAQMESGHLEFNPQALDLPAFMDSIVEEFRLIDGAVHTLTFSHDLSGLFHIDASLFRHIAVNLISNALKYSPRGTEVRLSLNQNDETIMLTVQDQGIGIPAASLPHLFEPFHRAENAKTVAGTGLGLSLVRDCVQHHLGEIRVESQVDVGTTFIVEVPLRRAESN